MKTPKCFCGKVAKCFLPELTGKGGSIKLKGFCSTHYHEYMIKIFKAKRMRCVECGRMLHRKEKKTTHTDWFLRHKICHRKFIAKEVAKAQADDSPLPGAVDTEATE